MFGTNVYMSSHEFLLKKYRWASLLMGIAMLPLAFSKMFLCRMYYALCENIILGLKISTKF